MRSFPLVASDTDMLLRDDGGSGMPYPAGPYPPRHMPGEAIQEEARERLGVDKGLGTTEADKYETHVRLGFLLIGIGAVFSVMNQLLAGCIASGPCIPEPPLPIALPLGIFATGIAWVIVALWETHVAKIR